MSASWSVVVALVSIIVGATFAIRTRRHTIARFESEFASRRPLDANGVVVGADTFTLAGSPTHAVLVLHGFGDTPQSIRPVAVALNNAGWTVLALRLPGHGRAIREYAQSREQQWIDAVRAAYDELKATHEVVVLCGISMGAALSVILAESHPEIPAVALLAPYLVMPRAMHVKTELAHLFDFMLPYHANTGSDSSIHDPVARSQTLGMGVVTANLLAQLRSVALHAQHVLPNLKARVLYLQSRQDNRINADDAVSQFARIGSKEKVQRWLTGCGHIITVDYCKDEVSRQVVEWFAPELANQGSATNTKSA